ncbi:hypothetical protein D1Q00_gp162 [Trichoplusia ni granulovirus LBIV-12]|jgi:hypothetical protein|uniref:Ac53 n=2 Tax=Betabaculovirus TaxID=558017 RepID=A0A1D8QLI0_GVTN|nr:hypothetical protein PsunGV_gp173 [Pseudalatia unipuncta granulovirus]YP_009506232.1 hypothetical protein D1Q00_gp162 [Trichoplusia ni granulovirus LBIV-12]ACH69523.1 unknown [Pseudalatia unipuncta granulovirus]AOW41500.1 hypothetical protein [Trichoplusia ni granulovirus LBIV-12]
MDFFITTKSALPKECLERIIYSELGDEFECAICCGTIDKYHSGVIVITCGGMADLEHLFCKECDVKFKRNDPYKRTIEFKFAFPFTDDNAALSFIDKTNKIIINYDDEQKQERLKGLIKNFSGTVDYKDVSFDFNLNLL